MQRFYVWVYGTFSAKLHISFFLVQFFQKTVTTRTIRNHILLTLCIFWTSLKNFELPSIRRIFLERVHRLCNLKFTVDDKVDAINFRDTLLKYLLPSYELFLLHVMINPLDCASPQMLKHAVRSKVRDYCFKFSLFILSNRGDVGFAT